MVPTKREFSLTDDVYGAYADSENGRFEWSGNGTTTPQHPTFDERERALLERVYADLAAVRHPMISNLVNPVLNRFCVTERRDLRYALKIADVLRDAAEYVPPEVVVQQMSQRCYTTLLQLHMALQNIRLSIEQPSYLQQTAITSACSTLVDLWQENDRYMHNDHTLQLLEDAMYILEGESLDVDVDSLHLIQKIGPVPLSSISPVLLRQMEEEARERFAMGNHRPVFHGDESVVYTFHEDKLLAFFTMTEMPGDMICIDWVTRPRNGAVPRMGCATLLSSLRKMSQEHDFYLAMKPHVRTMQQIMKHMPAVCFGCSGPEYQEHYLYVRILREEQTGYIGSWLKSSERAELISVAHEETIVDHPMRDRTLRCCIASFSTRDALQDISPRSREGSIFSAVQTCAKEGYGMTGYYPLLGHTRNDRYLCVFEPSTLSPKREQEIWENVQQFHNAPTTPPA